MVFIEPEKGAADEKIPYLVSAIIKDITLPFRMEALFRVCMFIEVFTIKIGEPMLIRREM